MFLAYTNGAARLCRELLKAGGSLATINRHGVSIFNAQVPTKKLLYTLLGKYLMFVFTYGLVNHYREMLRKKLKMRDNSLPNFFFRARVFAFRSTAIYDGNRDCLRSILGLLF